MSRVIGIIGGMGPEATIEFQHRILCATPARDDADHLHVIIDNNPQIPSRIRALIEGDGTNPAPVLAAMARGLEAAGAELLAMPCNTAHHYLPAVAAAVTIPVLDMVALTVRALESLFPPPRRVAMLASPAVRITGLYDARLRAVGIEPIHAEGIEAERLLAVIRAVKAAAVTDDVRADYAALIESLVSKADALLVACTELSLLPPPAGSLPAVDALDVLVAEVVNRAQN